MRYKERTVRNPERFRKEIVETRVPYGMIAVWGLGQASFVLKGGSDIVYIDPFVMGDDLVESRLGISRSYPAPIGPEHIDNADYCLITHEHADHLDPIAIAAMAKAKPDTLFMAPACCSDELLAQGVPRDRLVVADTRRSHGENDGGVVITPVPAAHEELETDERGYHRYVGYLIRMNGVTVYHAGDTVIYDGLAERLRGEEIQLALLPINGRDAFRNGRHIVGNMNYREAAELAHLAGFDMTVPMHYDLFAGNAERPGYFVDYVYDHYPQLPIHVIARGERYLYVTEAALG